MKPSLETRLHTRAFFGGSAHRPSNWRLATDAAAHRRVNNEFTLGLDQEWDDIPTAELELASVEESTVGLDEPRQSLEAAMAADAPEGINRSAIQPASPACSSEKTAAGEARPEPKATVNESAVGAAAAQAPAAPSVSSEPLPRDVTPGTLLCNRYVLGRVLGVGGSSLIFQAEDRRRVGAKDFGTRIAIKVLRPQMRANVHALTRLRREFRQMRRLSHDGIAKVYEIEHDEDVWFMTMELIEGQTINEWLKTAASQTLGLKIVASCCEALHHAHEAGVVHGDLKPSNVLVLPDGNVKLVDFGSAAERDAAMEVIDKERSFAATPPYASPQVLAGNVADPSDDVFSLACLTYTVLTRGEHPFERKSSTEAQQAQMKPVYARGLLPRQFDVLVRALSWDREQRTASARGFLHALLASDLRRDASTRDSMIASTDVASKPQAAPSQAPTAAMPPVVTPDLDVRRADDAARLRAALAAAEAHVERIDELVADKASSKADPLGNFKGYVAGPLAYHAADDIGARDFRAAPASQSPQRKRTWPWQRSSLLSALIIVAAAMLASRFDLESEPVKPAAVARPHAQTLAAKPVVAVRTPQLDSVLGSTVPEEKTFPLR